MFNVVIEFNFEICFFIDFYLSNVFVLNLFSSFIVELISSNELSSKIVFVDDICY